MKILVMRFSSIGDILMTTPVLRGIKKQIPHCMLHFLTKERYAYVNKNNPHIDVLHTLREGQLWRMIFSLQRQHFDYVVDLHNSPRSFLFRLLLSKKGRSSVFRKHKRRKIEAIYAKKLVRSIEHTVTRAWHTVSPLNVQDDGEGIDYFFDKEYVLASILPQGFPSQFIAIVIGGSRYTRRAPNEKLVEIISRLQYPVALLGGAEDVDRAITIQKACKGKVVWNTCGVLTFDESAFIIKHATYVISNDTGLMHIAASFNKKMVTIWGHNLPEFGNAPYKVSHHKVIEVKGLSCRPCSMHGSHTCPKGHFLCMKKIDISEIIRFCSM